MDHGGPRATTVLMVEADGDERNRLGTALERAGYRVIRCTGPTGPDYSCVGGREGRCPLVDDAGMVVLDLWLASDEALEGTSSDELLRLYLACGRPVITLGSPERWNHSYAGEQVIRLDRRPGEEELVGLVRAVARTIQRTGTE